MNKHSWRTDRRTFLRALGSAVVLSSFPGALRSQEVRAPSRRFTIREDRFGHMFPELAPFAAPSTQLEAALMELGRPGGLMDAKDDLQAGPIELIANSELSKDNPNSTAQTAGMTFVGQFIDHDMTFDLTSRLGLATEPEDSANTRTPALDLDSVYGGGPSASPELYDSSDRPGNGSGKHAAKFKIENGGLFEDLPRTSGGAAIIADPRNDENLMIAGLHAAFLLFHNQAVEMIAKDGSKDKQKDFEEARRLTRWHYQWIAVHEILPHFIGQSMVEDILTRGRKYYLPDRPYIPVEFQGAAYRFGHTMVRPSYRANLKGDNGQPFFGMIFDPSQEGAADPNDLRGGARAPRRFIGWQTFFDFGDGEVKPNKQIDAAISTPMFNLPVGAIATPGGPTSLPQRNLLRHLTWQLPSGQSVARHMNVPSLSPGDLPELKELGQGLEVATPLWYYILKEAKVVEGGAILGPVGGRIVGEVILGLLQLDRDSYVSSGSAWRPTLPGRNGQVTGEFQTTDFLTFAGVAPASRGQ